MKTFRPHLDILPLPQQRLWAELHLTPPTFTLYGGTALALQLGHRYSVDFDFFCFSDFDADRLLVTVPYLAGARITHRETNTLTCLVDRGGPVKLSFFGLPNLKRVAEPLLTGDNGLPCARLIDVAGTKAQTVQARASTKDYIDIDALIHVGELPLSHHLTAARHIFGPVFEPLPTLKALSYFVDVPDLPFEIQQRLAAAVLATDVNRLPPLSAINTLVQP